MCFWRATVLFVAVALFSGALGCPVVLVVFLLFFCLVSRLVMLLLSGVPVGDVFGGGRWCCSGALGCPVVLVVFLLFFCLVSRLVMFLVVARGVSVVLWGVQLSWLCVCCSFVWCPGW